MQTVLCRAAAAVAILASLSSCESSPPVSDAAVLDMREPGDKMSSSSFPDILKGDWLVGRFDGTVRQVSWLRLPRPTAPNKVTDAWVLSGKDIAGATPFWTCEGKTSWTVGTNRVVYLDLDALGCDTKPVAPYGYYFTNFTGTRDIPAGALLVANAIDRAQSEELIAYKFPFDWCNADMTQCPDPF